MRAPVIAALALLGGCLAGQPPTIDARRACTAHEGTTFTAGQTALTIFADDAEYSGYEWTQADGSVTSGLVQCETRGQATLLFADAAESATGRIDATRVYWFGALFATEFSESR